MSYRVRRQAPRRRRTGCLATLVLLVWIVVLGLLVYRTWLRPQVSTYVGEQIGSGLQGELASALPTALAGSDGGVFVVTEQQINDYLTSDAGTIEPLERVTLRLQSNRAEAEVQAYSTTSTISAGLLVQNGRVVVVDPQVNGPLGQLLDVSAITRQLEEQINAELDAAGLEPQSVRIEPGQVIISIVEAR